MTTPRAVRASIRIYGWLLRGYPPAYRLHFTTEMSQVFCLILREKYDRAGSLGVLRLWLPVLWDWSWTAADAWSQQILKRRRPPMYEGLDRQLGDLAWSIATGLRAGYGLRQTIDALSSEAPEPAAQALRLLQAELAKGCEMPDALAAWKKAVSSAQLAKLVDLLLSHRQIGGNLADLLDPLSEEYLRECGSDPAFYEAMKREAEQLGAKIPERIKS